MKDQFSDKEVKSLKKMVKTAEELNAFLAEVVTLKSRVANGEICFCKDCKYRIKSVHFKHSCTFPVGNRLDGATGEPTEYSDCRDLNSSYNCPYFIKSLEAQKGCKPTIAQRIHNWLNIGA